MDEQTLAISERLTEIVLPHAVKQRALLTKRKGRFVHYTSAENAIKIFNSKQVWLRSVRSMNDYMEVEHGFKYLFDFLSLNISLLYLVKVQSTRILKN